MPVTPPCPQIVRRHRPRRLVALAATTAAAAAVSTAGGESGFVGAAAPRAATSTHISDGFITLTYPQPVVAARTSTSLMVAPYLALPGATVTYTATISPTPDGGTVAFTDAGTGIVGCAAVSVTPSGQAICTTTYGTPGNHTVTAGYGGTPAFAASTSPGAIEAISCGQQVLSYSASTRRGGIVAIALRLTGAGGTNLSSASVTVRALAIDGGPLGQVVTSGGSNFPYVPVLKAYTFLAVQTAGLTPGTHTLTYTAAGDPLTHSITFTTR